MIIFDKITGFIWDKNNILKIVDKHHVHWSECEEIFFNEPLIAGKDKKHSQKENRYYALGITNNKRKLFVVYTIRKNKIRVITARNMTVREVKKYEKEKTNT